MIEDILHLTVIQESGSCLHPPTKKLGPCVRNVTGDNLRKLVEVISRGWKAKRRTDFAKGPTEFLSDLIYSHFGFNFEVITVVALLCMFSAKNEFKLLYLHRNFLKKRLCVRC